MAANRDVFGRRLYRIYIYGDYRVIAESKRSACAMLRALIPVSENKMKIVSNIRTAQTPRITKER